jgi:hypothetical protein
VRIVAGAPARQDFSVPAQRSVSGRVRAPKGAKVRVTALELGRSVGVGSDGSFVLRGLPAGRMTLVAADGRREQRRVIDLPAGPAMLRGIDLSL